MALNPTLELSRTLSLPVATGQRRTARPVNWTGLWMWKTGCDLVLSLLAMPVVAVISILLLVVNPILNPGPLFFRQTRLGRDQRRFNMWKFRTMRPGGPVERSALDGLEEHRIPPLGRLLRRLRIDELPNFLNVLSGEMSVVGPRPDAANHAAVYLVRIPDYAQRFRVKPGITGLAQVESGYAEGLDATAQKAAWDRTYVERSSIRLETYIIRRTIWVLFTGFGAK